ncbi:TPA: hypothetical protein DCF80_01025 [Candidatus Saccharibacteria bacterium]|nr:hypothetical protein [Candidatus Saccharibacteria bacterium]HRK41210.1 NUDIX domain-containing protein [Candidatus Saccharibacteria bacterium]
MEVSIGFIKQGDTYLLQRRPNLSTIGAAGLIGSFGGGIEVGESPIEAVCRELSEETSLKPLPEDFSHLGVVRVTAYKQGEPMDITAEVFMLELDPEVPMTALEGELERMTRQQADERVDELTPATRKAFEMFL